MSAVRCLVHFLRSGWHPVGGACGSRLNWVVAAGHRRIKRCAKWPTVFCVDAKHPTLQLRNSDMKQDIACLYAAMASGYVALVVTLCAGGLLT